jgi:cysteine synthase A
MVRVNAVLPEAARHARCFVKLEMQNPGGSIKDRIAKSMIEAAEKDGSLKPGDTIVEATSGNTGIGLAMVAAAKGYKCIIVMPQLPAFLERYLICRQFGAEVHLTAPGKGFKGLLAHCDKLKEDNPTTVWLASQFYNEANPAVHRATTGPEVLAQAGGKVDVFIHGVGTGGTIGGAGGFLKEKCGTKVVCIEPSNARVHVGDSMNPHTILGIAPGLTSNFFGMDKEKLVDGPNGVVDEWAHASSDEAVEWAQKAAKLEGIMCGPSAGAALKVLAEIAARPESAGKTIVAVLASHGIRYTAHPLWKAVKEEAAQALPVPPNMDKEGPTLLWKSPKVMPVLPDGPVYKAQVQEYLDAYEVQEKLAAAVNLAVTAKSDDPLRFIANVLLEKK